jgi:hypothetical protein
MQKTYLPVLIKFSLLFLITTQVNAKHNFSNTNIIANDYALIIYNEITENEVILTDGDLIEGNLFGENKYFFGRISNINKKTISINGELIKISDIKRIRKTRTQINRILKILGLVSLISGAALSIVGASGFVLFGGVIILVLVSVFQSKYIHLEHPDVKIEIKEL